MAGQTNKEVILKREAEDDGFIDKVSRKKKRIIDLEQSLKFSENEKKALKEQVARLGQSIAFSSHELGRLETVNSNLNEENRSLFGKNQELKAVISELQKDLKKSDPKFLKKEFLKSKARLLTDLRSVQHEKVKITKQKLGLELELRERSHKNLEKCLLKKKESIRDFTDNYKRQLKKHNKEFETLKQHFDKYKNKLKNTRD